MLGVGLRAKLAARNDSEEQGAVIWRYLALLVKGDLRLAAGSGQARRIDDVRDVVALPSIAPNLVHCSVLEFPPPQTSG
jgi:hypothetical protein